MRLNVVPRRLLNVEFLLQKVFGNFLPIWQDFTGAVCCTSDQVVQLTGEEEEERNSTEKEECTVLFVCKKTPKNLSLDYMHLIYDVHWRLH